jgi:hypothetical protein
MLEAGTETGIGVRRARDYCGICRSLRVLIDGRPAGAVGYGRRALFPTPPGVYTVQVAMDWCRSETCEVHVRAGEVIELEGGLRWRGLAWRWSLLAVFLAPGWVFVVREVGTELPPSRLRTVWEGIGVAVGFALILLLALRLALWLVA